MKALRLTWLHSCLLGGRRPDYRVEPVLPPSPAWTNTLFKEAERSGDERAGVGRATVVVVVVLMMLLSVQVLPVQPARPLLLFQDRRLCISDFEQRWT